MQLHCIERYKTRPPASVDLQRVPGACSRADPEKAIKSGLQVGPFSWV